MPRQAADDYLSVLHITPLRASRPLALRYLAQRLGLPLDRWVVLALAPEAAGSVAGGSLVVGSYCSDSQDLVGGMQQASRGGGGWLAECCACVGAALSKWELGSWQADWDSSAHCFALLLD